MGAQIMCLLLLLSALYRNWSTRFTSCQQLINRVRNVEAVPSKKEVEDRNWGHAVFRSWFPRCVKGRAEACGHRKSGGEAGDAPAVSLDYIYMRSAQG